MSCLFLPLNLYPCQGTSPPVSPAVPILSLCKLAAIYAQTDHFLQATLHEKHPLWRVPQVAVLGLVGEGKSSLLERLLLLSVFPCRDKHDKKERNGDRNAEEISGGGVTVTQRGGYTSIPLHIKLRHVHPKATVVMPPAVLRVIDTDRKVI